MQNGTKPAHVVGVLLDDVTQRGEILTIIRPKVYTRVYNNRFGSREFMNGSRASALERRMR